MSSMSSTLDIKIPESCDLEKQESDPDVGSQLDGFQQETYHSHQRLRAAELVSKLAVKDGEVYQAIPEKNPRWYQRLLDVGVEENGIKPVPVEQRTLTQYSNLFTVFFTCLLCLLPVPTGMLATLEFGMSLRDASLVILFFGMFTCIPPAFMGIGGMETGLRQLIQARYSFGRYLVTIPLLLNAATVTGFSLVSVIVGGQTIAALDPDSVSVNVGIVIVCLVSFVVSLLGFGALHFYERWTWIPNLIALLIAVGSGGRYLHLQAEVPPMKPSQILSYGGLIAGYFITFGGVASDYTIYYSPRGVSRIFLYTYLGLLLPSVPLLILGAAIGGAVPSIPSWSAAYGVTGIGGVMHEMLLSGVGRVLGSLVLVLLALSVVGNVAMSMYSVSLNLQMLLVPSSLGGARAHRFVFILATTASMVPLAIRAAAEWQTSLTNFLALIGYWAGCFDAVLIAELVVFRRMDYATYEHGIWNVGGRLPAGVAALGASLVSMGLVVPGMAEPWYTGLIAETTGDIGFEMAFVVTGLCYLPFRWLEIRLMGRF